MIIKGPPDLYLSTTGACFVCIETIQRMANIKNNWSSSIKQSIVIKTEDKSRWQNLQYTVLVFVNGF